MNEAEKGFAEITAFVLLPCIHKLNASKQTVESDMDAPAMENVQQSKRPSQWSLRVALVFPVSL